MDKSLYLTTIKKRLTEEIREHIKSGASLSELNYINKALNDLKSIYKGDMVLDGGLALARFFAWKSDDIAGVSKIWDEIHPELEKHIADTIKLYKSRRMVTEIKQLSAQAKIKEAMEGTGLKYIVIPQTYRAKVAVKIGDRNKVIFYVTYKNMDEDIQRNISATQSLITLLTTMGKGVSIQKLMPYENW